MQVEKTDNNRSLTLAQAEFCDQLERSDRSGQALWWPQVAAGEPAPDCVVFIKETGRFAVMLPPGQYSVEDDDWYRHDSVGGKTQVSDLIEEAWQAAMQVRLAIKGGLGIGAYTIPVIIFHDMEPNAGIMEAAQGRGVRGAGFLRAGRGGPATGHLARRGATSTAAGQPLHPEGGGRVAPCFCSEGKDAGEGIPGVNGGGKVDHMGGSIVGLRRWKTVPPATFYKVDYQPLEGETDVSSGDVRSGAAGRHGGRHERSGSLPGVRPAPRHGAQDAGLLGAAGLPARGSATATQPFDKLRRRPSPA